MSKPATEATVSNDYISETMSEIISAMSSLNMYPEPLDLPPEFDPDTEDPRFLSRVDGWAKHCYEHLCGATIMLTRVETERTKLRMQIHQLKIKLAEAQKGHHPCDLNSAPSTTRSPA